MLVLYFKNGKASFREKIFGLEPKTAKHLHLVKSTNRQYLGLEAKNEENEGTLLSKTLKVGENKVVLLFSFLASWPRY